MNERLGVRRCFASGNGGEESGGSKCRADGETWRMCARWYAKVVRLIQTSAAVTTGDNVAHIFTPAYI